MKCRGANEGGTANEAESAGRGLRRWAGGPPTVNVRPTAGDGGLQKEAIIFKGGGGGGGIERGRFGGGTAMTAIPHN